MKIYIVKASQGSYDSQYDWNVISFKKYSDAKDYVEQAKKGDELFLLWAKGYNDLLDSCRDKQSRLFFNRIEDDVLLLRKYTEDSGMVWDEERYPYARYNTEETYYNVETLDYFTRKK